MWAAKLLFNLWLHFTTVDFVNLVGILDTMDPLDCPFVTVPPLHNQHYITDDILDDDTVVGSQKRMGNTDRTPNSQQRPAIKSKTSSGVRVINKATTLKSQ